MKETPPLSRLPPPLDSTQLALPSRKSAALCPSALGAFCVPSRCACAVPPRPTRGLALRFPRTCSQHPAVFPVRPAARGASTMHLWNPPFCGSVISEELLHSGLSGPIRAAASR
nr:U6 snRNA-associated Sm-like protein LSm2 isoform X3 [Pan troglodytes]